MIESINPSLNFDKTGAETSPRVKESGFAVKPAISFEQEDEAIISAHARLLNELDKYNAGESDETSLALACVESKLQVKCAAKVFETKKDMLDTVINMVR